MNSLPTPPCDAGVNAAPLFRCLSALLLLGSALMLAVLGRGLLSGRVYTYDDLGNFYLPIRFLYRNALIHGDFFLWTPAYFCGAYAHGEGQVGMCHPLHLLLYRVLPLEMAFNLEFVLNYAALFPGMALLLRRLDLPRHAALFGAMLFTFSGFTLLHSNHINALGVIAQLPWLLVAIDVVLRTTDQRKAALARLAIALLTGSQCLMGYPQYVWFSLVGETAFALLQSRRAVADRRLLWVFVSILLGLALGAIQTLPTLDALSLSIRSNPTPRFRMAGSLTPINLLQLWPPTCSRTASTATPPKRAPERRVLHGRSDVALDPTSRVGRAAPWWCRWRDLRH